MKKLIVTIFLIMLCSAIALFAADSKTTALVELTAVDGADIMYIVDGAITDKKITVLNLFDMIDTSAELLGIVQNETGTGALVFATSPTFVTPILGTITSGVGTALTALNGENIQDDTIDDDSIDWADCTFDDFDFETAWRMWYSDAAGDVTAVALGANGTFLESNGADQIPAFRTLAAGDIPDISATYQPLEATLTDIADGTIVENLVNTDNPWADNEVADNITIDLATLATTVTVSDDEATDDDQEVVFTTDNTNLESDGDFHYSPDTGTVTATQFVGGGAGLTGTLTAYDAIADPGGAGSISFNAAEGATYTSSEDEWVGMTISNTQADNVGDTELLTLAFTDDGDTNSHYLIMSDAAGTQQLEVIQSTADVQITTLGDLKFIAGGGDFTFDNDNITTTGTIEGATLTEGGNAVPNATDHLGFFGGTTSLQLLNEISNETGTGALVFATSPTLVTPILGTITSGVGTALTALNGENIQDNTIDVDSLDWGAFTDLGEGGAVTWGNIAEGELANSTVIDADIKDDTIQEPALNTTNAAGAGTDNYLLSYNNAGTNFTWVAAGDGDMLKATYDSGISGGVDVLTTIDSTYAGDYVLLVGGAVGQFAPKTDAGLTYAADTGTLTATQFVGGGAGITGLSVTYENIGDPAAAGSITFQDTETATYITQQNTADSFFTIDNTVADVGNQVYLLDLDYSVDDNQVLADYFKCQDAGGVVFSIQENGDTVTTGDITGNKLDLTGGNITYLDIGDNIETAIATATAGDTIVLAAGTYTVTDDIDIMQAITVRGQGRDSTTVYCATSSKNVFDITADNVHIKDLFISVNAGATRAVYVDATGGNIFSNVTLENVNVTLASNNGSQYAIYYTDAGGLIRDCEVRVTSTDNTAQGIILSNKGTAEAVTNLYIYDSYVSVSASANTSIGIYVYDNTTEQDCTINLWNCYVFAAEGAACNSYGIAADGGDAYIYAYFSYLQAVDYDAANLNTAAAVNLRNSVLASNTTSGTVTQTGTLAAAGIIATGNIDFGGADLELPQGQTPDTDGDVDLDFTDGSVVIQHGSAHAELGAATDVVVGKLIKSFAATIFQPDQVNDVIPLKMIDDLEFPHGVVIVECLLQVGTDSNYTLTLQNYDDFDTINAGNGTIDAVAYTAGNNGEVTDTTITYGTIAAGQIIMLSIPSTDVDWVHIEVFYYEPIA